MKIGTRSLLFGAHQFLLHPIFVFMAWCHAYGFPWDPRLWTAFLVHDWGYWGKPNMDGPEGEQHVMLGAQIMGVFGLRWKQFTLYHSRYWCKQSGQGISRLCVADKLAIFWYPVWLYVLCTRLTGEINEYRTVDKHVWEMGACRESDNQWFERLRQHMRQWAFDHLDEARSNDYQRGMTV